METVGLADAACELEIGATAVGGEVEVLAVDVFSGAVGLHEGGGWDGWWCYGAG